MKFFLATLLLFHGALNSQGLLSDAWKDAQQTSSQTKTDAGQKAHQAIQKMIADLEKKILERPDLSDCQYGCAEKKLLHLKQLSNALESSLATLSKDLKVNNQDDATLQYGIIKATLKKAEEISRNSSSCFQNENLNSPALETYEEAALRTNTGVTDTTSGSGVNAPNKPIVIPRSLQTDCASPPCSQ